MLASERSPVASAASATSPASASAVASAAGAVSYTHLQAPPAFSARPSPFFSVAIAYSIFLLLYSIFRADILQTAFFTIGFGPRRTDLPPVINQAVTEITALLRWNQLPPVSYTHL